jgi:hypothetical protein
LYKIEQMEPEPGTPAYYERLASQAGPSVPPAPVPGGPPPIRKLPLPPEAVESNANRKSREGIQRLFRQLNNPHSSAHRNSYKKKYGVNWATVRNQKKRNFNSQQAAKAATRKEALERHRNAEWAAYIEEWKAWRNSLPPPEPGTFRPTMGYPVRLIGGTTRKRSSKKKNGLSARSRRQ